MKGAFVAKGASEEVVHALRRRSTQCNTEPDACAVINGTRVRVYGRPSLDWFRARCASFRANLSHGVFPRRKVYAASDASQSKKLFPGKVFDLRQVSSLEDAAEFNRNLPWSSSELASSDPAQYASKKASQGWMVTG